MSFLLLLILCNLFIIEFFYSHALFTLIRISDNKNFYSYLIITSYHVKVKFLYAGGLEPGVLVTGYTVLP